MAECMGWVQMRKARRRKRSMSCLNTLTSFKTHLHKTKDGEQHGRFYGPKRRAFSSPVRPGPSRPRALRGVEGSHDPTTSRKTRYASPQSHRYCFYGLMPYAALATIAGNARRKRPAPPPSPPRSRSPVLPEPLEGENTKSLFARFYLEKSKSMYESLSYTNPAACMVYT